MESFIVEQGTVQTLKLISTSTRVVSSGGFRGGRAGRAPPPPKIRKAYVIQR